MAYGAVRNESGAQRNKATSKEGLDIYPLRIYHTFMLAKPSPSPLTPAVFHILLALSTGERHGYGIMKQVETDSEGKVKMGPGTLYGSLKRMLDAGLVKESERRVDPALDNERRIYYALTAEGRAALAAEIARYRKLVELIDERKLPLNPLAYGR